MAVALYARVSTTRQAEQDLSIPDQLKQMRDWCEREGQLVAAEYVEPGASATDDKRPVFQQMMADAQRDPPPFTAIVVHSQSRFFRDAVDFGLYERRLGKQNISLVSITQPIADDPSGRLARSMFSVFDEYQSRENSKHTSRAMRENARQGYFNGSSPPFGYDAVETEALGNRGRKKRKLAKNDGEAATVRKIYRLYLHGYRGASMGMKRIVEHLNACGELMRGNPWGIQKVQKILSCPTYRGDYYYNVIDSRTGRKRPPSEWILVPIEPIVDTDTFEWVRQRREGRRPTAVPPRRLSSPILLTGLLKCGECGASWTHVTGKSGAYHYYKCTTRVNKGNPACASRNLPMQTLDELVLQEFEQSVLAPTRLKALLTEGRRYWGKRKDQDRSQLAALKKELAKADKSLDRLYEAVESGVLPLDGTLQKRVQRAKAKRDSVLVEIAGISRSQSIPSLRTLPSQIERFGSLVAKKLRDRSNSFGREYLHALVDEIVVGGNLATLRGSYGTLATAVASGKMSAQSVPKFMGNWRAREDSNL